MKKTEPLTPIFKIESTLLHPSPLKWGLALRGHLSASRRSPLDLLGLAPRRARAPFGPARLSLSPRAPLLFPSPGPDESGDSSQKNTKTSKTHPRLRIRASLTRYESPEVESGTREDCQKRQKVVRNTRKLSETCEDCQKHQKVVRNRKNIVKQMIVWRLRFKYLSENRYESPEVESGSSHTELPLLGDGNQTQRGGLPRHIPGISAKCMGW